MHDSNRLQSLFSQKLDRAVFGTYFLGAAFPSAGGGAFGSFGGGPRCGQGRRAATVARRAAMASSPSRCANSVVTRCWSALCGTTRKAELGRGRSSICCGGSGRKRSAPANSIDPPSIEACSKDTSRSASVSAA